MAADLKTDPVTTLDDDAAVVEVDKPDFNFCLYGYQTVNRGSEQEIAANGSVDVEVDGDVDVDVKVDVDVDDQTTGDDFSDNLSIRDLQVHFSLSVLATDLNTVEEAELRDHVTKTLSKPSGPAHSGLVTSVSLQSLEDDVMVKPDCHGCYQRLFLLPSTNHQAETQSRDLSSTNQQTESLSRGYVVCFVTKQERGLELFQPELDKYSEGLLQQLRNHPEASTIGTSVQAYLASWYTESVEYIGRCVNLLQSDLQYVIYAALSDMRLEVKNSPARNQVDLLRFLSSCSLSEMLRSDVTDDVTQAGDNNQSDGLKQTLMVDLSEETPLFENKTSTCFCGDWAETLTQAAQSSPYCLRQLIENYKLKVIQDMNHLRRLLRQAETDHYALFRTYTFLKNSSNVTVLLHQARHQTMTSQTDDVINVLDEYIRHQPIGDSAG